MEYTLIDRKSWHYRLATAYGPGKTHELDRGTNFCTYFWAVFRGGLGALVLTAVLGLIAWGVGDILAWLVAGLVTSFTKLGTAGELLTGFVAIIAIIIACGVALLLMGDLWEAHKERQSMARLDRKLAGVPEKPAGFVRVAYRTVYDKYCVAIKAEPLARDEVQEEEPEVVWRSDAVDEVLEVLESTDAPKNPS